MLSNFEELSELLLHIFRGNSSSEPDIWPKLTPPEWTSLVELAGKQYVLSVLYDCLKTNGLKSFVPPHLWQKMQDDFRSSAIRNLQIKGQLINLSKKFKPAEIPFIALKGSHLAFTLYKHPALRYMRDIDILVPPEKAVEAFRIAQKMGYVSYSELNKYDYSFSILHHLPEMNKDGIVLEIHGDILLNTDKHYFDNKLLWNNSQPFNLDNNEILVLDPVDLLIHLCVHISYSDIFAIDLRHYYDIFTVLTCYQDFEWDDLVNRVKEYNLRRGVYLVLQIIKRLFLIKYPDFVNDLLSVNERQASEQLVLQAIDIMWQYHKDPENMEKYDDYRNTPRILGDYQKSSFVNKLRVIGKRIFLPPVVLASKYHVRAKTPLIYFYYLIRMKDLLIKYTGNIFRIARGDKNYNRSFSLQEWLNS